MTTTPSPLAASIEGFLRACAGKNRSPEMIRAYRTDVGQFVTCLQRPVGAREYDSVPFPAQRPHERWSLDVLTDNLIHAGASGS